MKIAGKGLTLEEQSGLGLRQGLAELEISTYVSLHLMVHTHAKSRHHSGHG